MRVVVTGSSAGMGLAAAKKFLNQGHEVIGIDILPVHKDIVTNPFFSESYTHYIANIVDRDELPDLDGVEILVNNAGVQGSGRDVDINLKGLMNVTEKYAINNPYIKSVLNQASASAHMGTEFGEYVASKGGVIAYTKWTAKEIAKYGATCNSLSFGGVSTELNKPVMNDPELWAQIMDETPLRRWATTEEIAEWAYFLAVTNRFCTGQNILVDGGEAINYHFVWKD